MTDTCEHEDFCATVEVTRLTRTEGGQVNGFSASVIVSCVVCGVRFEWIGPPIGLAWGHPTVSVDGTELRAPLRPPGSDPALGSDGFGFTVSIAGGNVVNDSPKLPGGCYDFSAQHEPGPDCHHPDNRACGYGPIR